MQDDDYSDLGAYFAEFSLAGSVPTGLSGYGYGQARHETALQGTFVHQGALGAASPESLGMATKGVQFALNRLGYKGANGKKLVEDDQWGKNSKTALDSYTKARSKEVGSQFKFVAPKRSRASCRCRRRGVEASASLERRQPLRRLPGVQPQHRGRASASPQQRSLRTNSSP
jgi:hypothetical protein